ncbi:hypothetical protein FACS1894216_00970 [Synergistales bacterium]|nr:hypothetical protein FACS1894216_00970 [Synergistales bacterium]
MKITDIIKACEDAGDGNVTLEIANVQDRYIAFGVEGKRKNPDNTLEPFTVSAEFPAKELKEALIAWVGQFEIK